RPDLPWRGSLVDQVRRRLISFELHPHVGRSVTVANPLDPVGPAIKLPVSPCGKFANSSSVPASMPNSTGLRARIAFLPFFALGIMQWDFPTYTNAK
ncbi:MAG TPA: hypothetical protein VFQ89_13125, partial [Candidatus Binatia bacterium]|nr:hypothetical protein [Candidatus Binatia bacterium]